MDVNRSQLGLSNLWSKERVHENNGLSLCVSVVGILVCGGKSTADRRGNQL
jgi:hypothetical protein